MKSISSISKLLSSVTKMMLGAGSVLVATYCLVTGSKPEGLELADTFVFLLVFLAFGLTYGVFIFYGMFSSIWLVKSLCRLGSRKLHQYWWLRGSGITWCSFISFALLILSFAITVNIDLAKAFGLSFAVGMLLAILLGIETSSKAHPDTFLEPTKAADWTTKWRWLSIAIVATLPMLMLPSIFINVTMQAIGIRAAGTHMAIMTRDNFKKVQAVAFAGYVPLSACIVPSDDQNSVLVFRIDFDWQGIGKVAHAKLLSRYRQKYEWEKPSSVNVSLDNDSVQPIVGNRFLITNGDDSAKDKAKGKTPDISDVRVVISKFESSYLLKTPFDTPKTCAPFI